MKFFEPIILSRIKVEQQYIYKKNEISTIKTKNNKQA